MKDTTPTDYFAALDARAKYADEGNLLQGLVRDAALSETLRRRISAQATSLVTRIRDSSDPTLMEHFLAEYGLSTREGVALMCLAEATLRVPDSFTMDALIEDKIVPSAWNDHLGTATSSLVNASTWALMLTGKVLDDERPGLAGTLRGAIKRLGEPVIRAAVKRAMTEMGRQFVLGETIEAALKRGQLEEEKGYTYSFDMLGEAARTQSDADRYAKDYGEAIAAIGKAARHDTVHKNPGISIKLSALHPRYEVSQEARVLAELAPVVSRLAHQARAAGIALHIDAEEQDRLVLSLKVIEAVLPDEGLAGWDGFGVVVQAYGKRAGMALDLIYDMATRHDRKLNIRLVKGAYWDTEMKLAQVAGMPDFSLFTTKAATDVSYICLAKKLFELSDRLYPQFATHNAHTVAAVLELAEGRAFEFQRLHGMGERLHDMILEDTGGACRIYAPVGAHRDLLAYLVRRLLENGANSSFVNQIVDEAIPAEEIAADPFEMLSESVPSENLRKPSDLFQPERANSQGLDLFDDATLAGIQSDRSAFPRAARPLTAKPATGPFRNVLNPATGETVGQVIEADEATVARAIEDAGRWSADPATRAAALRRAANLYEEHAVDFFGLLAEEAGKTLLDCVGEVREAVDFLRYYAAQGERVHGQPRGIIAAISPWNFPLAIFTGQISAALMGGNAVLAKPAEQTPLVAARAVELLHKAGVPAAALQLLPGPGATVGAALTKDPRVKGIVFTGSTATAQVIARTAAKHLEPGTPLIAETGGLNAMIVDSTALPEQAVRDVIASAFQSAGQRCSALRCVYVQKDSAPHIIEMIKGAMDELRLGDPRDVATDVGPVIDAEARQTIADYVASRRSAVLHQTDAPEKGYFIPPTLIEVAGIGDLEREVFGPVLHMAEFEGDEIDQIVADINASGYGLTFGLHTRIDTRVQEVADALYVGNVYVNRNQIGAVVGSQPFGGEGLSGTGPKAGGPHYLPRFYASVPAPSETGSDHVLPGPTGEMNRLSLTPRPPVLCLGPGEDARQQQVAAVEAFGGVAEAVETKVTPESLTTRVGFSGILWWGDAQVARQMAQALAKRDGPLVPLITGMPDAAHVLHERHLCVDTTAAGGNTALLAG